MKLTYDIDSVQKKIKNINILVFEYDMIFFTKVKTVYVLKICIYVYIIDFRYINV